MPGGNERFLKKALGLPADALILDLEDAVAPEEKDRAREVVRGWLCDIDFGRQERVVRMNPLDSPWGKLDLEATLPARPDAYLVPKVRGPEELRALDALIGRLEREHGRPAGAVSLIVLGSETPEGLLCIQDLARCPRVDALSWGPEDLAAELGARRNRDDAGRFLEVFRYARCMTLLAAAAARVQPVDTVYVDIRDPDGLRRECQEAAWMGFTGKMTLHPDQVSVVNEMFTPTPEEIAESRELIEAFEESHRTGAGVLRFRGRMVDAPHLARAQNILERARQADQL